MAVVSEPTKDERELDAFVDMIARAGASYLIDVSMANVTLVELLLEQQKRHVVFVFTRADGSLRDIRLDRATKV